MLDPLTEVVALLKPQASLSKTVVGGGAWRVRRSDDGQPFYCCIVEGMARLTLVGLDPVLLRADDFVLVPAAYDFTLESIEALNPTVSQSAPVAQGNGEFRIGAPTEPVDVRCLVGHCSFGSPDAALLVSLLPEMVHVRGEQRLVALVRTVGEESRARRPARDEVLTRLLEVLLIEALRATAGPVMRPGLARALADSRLARAIRSMHQNPARPWTVVQLAREASLSRSAFFERFNRAVGIKPMQYLVAWRMALAKDMLRGRAADIAEVAQRVGYGSASTFSVAFRRQVGVSPGVYARRSESRVVGVAPLHAAHRADSGT